MAQDSSDKDSSFVQYKSNPSRHWRLAARGVGRRSDQMDSAYGLRRDAARCIVRRYFFTGSRHRLFDDAQLQPVCDGSTALALWTAHTARLILRKCAACLPNALQDYLIPDAH